MAKPMRRSPDGSGGEPCTRRTWCNDILAGTQGDDPPPGMVDLDHHLLAARQEIVFGEGIAMGDLIELVAAGDVLHRPVRLGRFCEGDLRGCQEIPDRLDQRCASFATAAFAASSG